MPAWVLAALLTVVYLAINPPSADLAAQDYRTWLFRHAGPTVWDGGWYAGHHLPAYSVLFPPMSALLGPRIVGALAAILATWAFERLAWRARGAAGRPAALWFATASIVSLASGRLTFALGLALGLLAALALAHGKIGLAALAAAGTALGSPVAAAFLALALVAWGAVGRRPALAVLLVVASLGPALLLSAVFPEGGDFPFAADAFWPSLGATLVLAVVIGRHPGLLRVGIALYAVLLVTSAALSTPMGGNAVRLGAVLAGPLAALALWPHRRRALLLLAPALLFWQWTSPVDDVVRASTDPSVHASYYTGVLAFLQAEQVKHGPFRVEIPFTDNHQESAKVASGPIRFALARGWERQLDRKTNPLFYDDGGRHLTATSYRLWLDANAVRFVALADAPLDPAGAVEAALVRSDPPYLREVYTDEHWRVFEVTHATPPADGARVTAWDTSSVDLLARKPGRVLLRVHWTPYWRITAGTGCVQQAGDWTALRLRAAGRVRLEASFSISRVRATTPRCTPDHGRQPARVG